MVNLRRNFLSNSLSEIMIEGRTFSECINLIKHQLITAVFMYQCHVFLTTPFTACYQLEQRDQYIALISLISMYTYSLFININIYIYILYISILIININIYVHIPYMYTYTHYIPLSFSFRC